MNYEEFNRWLQKNLEPVNAAYHRCKLTGESVPKREEFIYNAYKADPLLK